MSIFNKTELRSTPSDQTIAVLQEEFFGRVYFSPPRSCDSTHQDFLFQASIHLNSLISIEIKSFFRYEIKTSYWKTLPYNNRGQNNVFVVPPSNLTKTFPNRKKTYNPCRWPRNPKPHNAHNALVIANRQNIKEFQSWINQFMCRIPPMFSIKVMAPITGETIPRRRQINLIKKEGDRCSNSKKSWPYFTGHYTRKDPVSCVEIHAQILAGRHICRAVGYCLARLMLHVLFGAASFVLCVALWSC